MASIVSQNFRIFNNHPLHIADKNRPVYLEKENTKEMEVNVHLQHSRHRDNWLLSKGSVGSKLGLPQEAGLQLCSLGQDCLLEDFSSRENCGGIFCLFVCLSSQ